VPEISLAGYPSSLSLQFTTITVQVHRTLCVLDKNLCPSNGLCLIAFLIGSAFDVWDLSGSMNRFVMKCEKEDGTI